MGRETKWRTNFNRLFSGKLGLFLGVSLVGFIYLSLSFNIGDPYVAVESNESAEFVHLNLSKVVDERSIPQPINVKLPSTDAEVPSTHSSSNPSVEKEKPFEQSGEETYANKPKNSLHCNFTDTRSDVCVAEGDVRIYGSSATVMLVATEKNDNLGLNEAKVLRPYTRKEWDYLMSQTKEVNVKPLNDPTQAPPCTVNHNVPAVIFSLGGYNMKNFYHHFSDVIVPLFMTTRQFNGEVQFLITSIQHWWVDRYKELLKRLSHYDVIDFDKEEKIHCYPKAIVGLYSGQKELIASPSRTTNGYSLQDYTDFLRSAFSLGRNFPVNLGEEPGKKPRLLIIERNHTRKIVNMDELISTATELGYEVVVEDASLVEVVKFAQIVNSCDVMVGVHGAGLTNLIFLPTNGVFVEIIPFGGIEGMSWNCYGLAALDMNLTYLQYTINEDESTLIELYPKDDPVFTDPASIHKKGWPAMAEIYLYKQNVKVNVTRFKPILVEALEHLSQ